MPGGLAVIQDDSNFLALFDPAAPAEARAVTLPPGADGKRQFGRSRDNKHLKLDLEACFVAQMPTTTLVALGSGSTPARESVLLVSGWPDDALNARVIPAPGFYAALRESTEFAGSELNVEGALLDGDSMRLFGRGNGAVNGSLQPISATCELSWPLFLAYLGAPQDGRVPRPKNIQRFLLGDIDGVSLGFTDATSWHDVVLFTAAAENSRDTYQDGPVTGSAIGVIGANGETRWTPIVGSDGNVLLEKAEGLAIADQYQNLWVVADADDEARPSELWRVQLEGPWLA